MKPRVLVFAAISLLALGAAAWMFMDPGRSDAPARVEAADDVEAGGERPEAPPPITSPDPERTGTGPGEAVPARETAEEEGLSDPTRLTCEGVVRDAEGEALVDAQVIIYEPIANTPGGRVLTYAMTDAEGHYSLRVPRGTNLKLGVSADGFDEQREDLLRRPLNGRDFVLRRR